MLRRMGETTNASQEDEAVREERREKKNGGRRSITDRRSGIVRENKEIRKRKERRGWGF